MRSGGRISGHHWLITSAMRRIALHARGPALPLVKGMLEQIPQFISAGMSAELALKESILLAIHLAQTKVRHCVGSERFALDEFITTCLQLEAETEYLLNV